MRVGLDEASLGKSSVEDQCGVMATNLVSNFVEMHSPAVRIFVILDVKKDLPDDVHVAFHGDVRMRSKLSNSAREGVRLQAA